MHSASPVQTREADAAFRKYTASKSKVRSFSGFGV